MALIVFIEAISRVKNAIMSTELSIGEGKMAKAKREPFFCQSWSDYYRA